MTPPQPAAARRQRPRRSSRPAPAPRQIGSPEAAFDELTLDAVETVAQIGSYSLDVLAGRWTSSRGLDRIFGIDEAFDRTVDTWASLVHPADRESMMAYLATEVLGQGKPFDRRYRVVRHDTGEARWVHGRGALTFGHAGRPVRMMGTIADVTDRHELVAENRKLAQAVRPDDRGGPRHEPNGRVRVCEPLLRSSRGRRERRVPPGRAQSPHG